MKGQETEMEELLRRTVPPIGKEDLPQHDLWPAMLQRMEQGRGVQHETIRRVPWFDWALAAGVGLLAVLSPALVPVLLYYL